MQKRPDIYLWSHDNMVYYNLQIWLYKAKNKVNNSHHKSELHHPDKEIFRELYYNAYHIRFD